MENNYNKRISEVEPMDFGDGIIPETREDFRTIIDEPCLPAILRLYDLNIRTSNCSANKEYVDSDEAGISIDYDCLSDQNKEIVNKLIADKIIKPISTYSRNGITFQTIRIDMHIGKNDTVGIISDRFMQIVSQFQQQDVLYGRLTHKDILKEASVFGISPEDLIEALGYIYDDELDLYWKNQELYNKHKQYQDKLKEQVGENERPDHDDN